MKTKSPPEALADTFYFYSIAQQQGLVAVCPDNGYDRALETKTKGGSCGV